MRIKLDSKHYLNSDQYNYWVTEVTKVGRKSVETECGGYYKDYHEALVACLDQLVRKSEAQSLEELHEEIVKLRRDIRTWKTCLKELG